MSIRSAARSPPVGRSSGAHARGTFPKYSSDSEGVGRDQHRKDLREARRRQADRLHADRHRQSLNAHRGRELGQRLDALPRGVRGLLRQREHHVADTVHALLEQGELLGQNALDHRLVAQLEEVHDVPKDPQVGFHQRALAG